MTPSCLRVTVVDDHSLFAESMAIALRRHDVEVRTVVPTSTTTVAQLERMVLDTRPQLVFLDLDLGIVGDGMRLLPGLSAIGVAVVIVTASADKVTQGEALTRGARSVIEKSSSFGEILSTVEKMRSRLPLMSPGHRGELIGAFRRAVETRRQLRRKFELLTRSEAEVLGELMAGKQVTEIARERVVSESTVRTQVKGVLAKLGVTSQLSAAGLAHQIGWRPPRDGGVPLGRKDTIGRTSGSARAVS